MPPPALHPPPDPAAYPAWLAWLDANRLTAVADRALAAEPLPADARAHLNAAYAGARAQWLLLRTALASFLAEMEAEPAVEVVLLKGVAVAATLYDDPACRPMNDIDVLVAPAGMSEAVGRLREAGYRERGLAPGGDVGYLHHFIFDSPSPSPVRFELHSTLPMLPEDSEADLLDWFLSQVEIIDIAGHGAGVLDPTAQLLHTSAHAVLEHGGEGSAVLIWFYDIDRLWRGRGEEIDWGLARRQAQILRWEAALHYALRTTRRYFNTPYPDMILAWLAEDSNELAGYAELQRMTSGGRTSSLIAFEILRGMTPSRRLTAARHMLFPHPAYMRQRYEFADSWLLPFAYPYRWLDAARKLLKSARHSNPGPRTPEH